MATRLRSRSPLLVSTKHHFTDPSPAVAALRASPDRLFADPDRTSSQTRRGHRRRWVRLRATRRSFSSTPIHTTFKVFLSLSH
ncbi:MAG: hypothetical protein OXI96_01095 [Acidimicrobiaceae bacterium]|nr:hypothetical protein [Acidimicrobiaceae bacterium]